MDINNCNANTWLKPFVVFSDIIINPGYHCCNPQHLALPVTFVIGLYFNKTFLMEKLVDEWLTRGVKHHSLIVRVCEIHFDLSTL